MESQKTIKLYVYVDGVNDVPFYGSDVGDYEAFILSNGEQLVTKNGFVFNVRNTNEQIELGSFRYDAKRMGGAPTISFSLMYEDCLDDFWSDNVYALFNGEKYFLKQTPTSSKSNEDARYRHDVELISARAILDNVLFYDAVVGDPQGEDKPVSNSTKFVFFGKIDEFARRLNASLQYAKLQKVDENGEYESGYRVVVDNGITSEAMFVSFEDQYFSNAIQESYNTFKVPYYFVGEDIHFGNSNGVIEHEFSYGVDDALLSITKSNANNKIVNRVTGKGSSENIPYYYPNNSPKGDVDLSVNSSATLRIADREKFASEVGVNDVITYNKGMASSPHGYYYKYEDGVSHDYTGTPIQVSLVDDKPQNIWIGVTITVENEGEFEIEGSFAISLGYDSEFSNFIKSAQLKNRHGSKNLSVDNGVVSCGVLDVGSHTIFMGFSFPYLGRSEYTVAPSVAVSSLGAWKDAKGKDISLRDIGLTVVSGSPTVGDTIRQTVGEYITPSTVLLPPKYRTSKGTERFYNAVNGEDGYKDEKGEDIIFNNPFVEGQPKEHIISVDDIKPTIKGATVLQPDGSSGAGYVLPIDMFTAFAYDENDNDETYVDDNGETFYEHPYFFGKLRVLDFNLFECANENQPMTISFTSGHCGACNFEIGATEDYPQLNPVQVTGEGELIYKDGRVWCGLEGVEGQKVDEYQPRQQDTSKYEVWIALKKEEETYGALMPSESIRPKACSSPTADDGDTFVILGINLPESYITNAEERLEAEIIKYMKDNNDEKFNFSITLSRIFFAENPTILEQLNENASLYVWYNGVRYPLYVSSISYNIGEGDVLPEVRLELVDSLSVSQNAIQAAISQVKAQMGNALANLDVLTAVTPFFIRKDQDDEVRGRVNFTKGIKFGEGGKVEVLDNNSAKLTIEYLEVTKKASFTSLEIQEKTHVGGQMLVTPAAINCGEVEELEDAYRCYFQTKGENGEEIFNQFAVGDQAICQTYNAWGSKYYWRLVTGIGEDYIDLSKTECDEDSDEPSAGDKIIQLGNQVDESRQNAIVIAAYGDGSPYIIQYKGINSFEIGDDKIVTKLSSTENIFTGKVHMELGSDGLENLNLEIGGQNMLRNSGFTGDYVSSSFTDEDVMDAATKLFSSPLAHWENEKASVQNSSESQSGKELVLTNGGITQTLYQKVIADESYALSFKAKGTSLTYSVGGVIKTVALTDSWVEYVEKITSISGSETFSITDATCVLCDLQLERGTMATKWSSSPFDNSSDRAYYQSLKYLQDALEGSTDVLGGLVLTEQVHVGDYDKEKKEWVKMSGGMSGIYEDDNDVAFWAGGSFDKAIEAVMKYEDDPTYQPTEEELASMANFVVTHGGRTILNDAIVRGKIYASGGVFRGDVYFGENSEGLDNINEWRELSNKLTKTEEGLIATNTKLGELQDQIDGVVDNYFLSGDPSVNKAPVTEWTTDEEKLNHVGDTYTNIDEFIDETTTPNAGRSWRWCECTALQNITDYVEVTDKNGNIKRLHWHPIADTDALKALQEAMKAKEIADGKSRTFISQPLPPYSEGDLWVQGTTGDIMRCKSGVNKEDGGFFDANDWEKASKYTDDTRANEAKNLAEEAKKNAEFATKGNLIPNSSTIKNYMLPLADYEDGGSSTYYAKILLPIKVNGGETYTFKCENAQNLSGSQTGYRIRIDDGTRGESGVTNVFSNWATLAFGENQTATLTISSGVVDRVAFLTFVRQSASGNSRSDSILLNNVSLVRGATPMSVWEDYKGDAAMDNLLLTEEEFISESTDYCYQYIDLPNNVNGGETYTVSIDNLQIEGGSTSDTQYQIEIASKDSNYTPKSNAITIDFKRKSWGTMTIWNSANDMPARLAIRKVNPNASTTARIKGIALVRGPLPLMEWKENPDKLKEKIASWAEDGVFSPTEITGLESERKRIEQEKLDINAQYNDAFGHTIGSALSEYNTAYSNYFSDLNSVIAEYNNASDKTKAISVPSTFDARLNAYYEKKTAVVATISAKIKGNIDAIPTAIENDFGYLKTAFAGIKEANVTTGDVFLGQMMGVGSNNGNNNFTVNAFLNGNDTFEGTEDEGKLMLATGIPTTGGTLAQRAAQATTRIYEMGKIETNELNAKGGKIGNFKIAEGKNLEYVDETTEAEMILNEKGITFYSNGAWKTGSYAHLGNGCDGGVVLQVIGDKTRGGYCHSAAVGENVGIHVMSNKAAIFCDEGMFYGFRPKTSVVQGTSVSKSLTEFDHTEVAKSSATYTLPSIPKNGQCYRLIKAGAAINITIKASGSTKIYDLISNSSKEQSFSVPYNVRMVEVVWDGNTTWYVDGASH